MSARNPLAASQRTLPLYKDVTYSQLRSFCEASRLGSMAAAARSLKLSHPTIWKQIRALERELGVTLIKSDRRNSEVTDAGRVLAQLAGVIVAEFENLGEHFHQACHVAPVCLNVAASPRLCTIDLPPVITEFRRRHPGVRLMIHEAYEHLGDDLLQIGRADILLGTHRYAENRSNVETEQCFLLEPVVVVPNGHPLASRRRISASDLRKYPVLNDPDGYPDDEVCAVLKKAGVFEHEGRCFNLVSAVSIRRCVKLGYGIGIVGRVWKNMCEPGLVERSLEHLFRPIPCYAYRLRRITENVTQRKFIDLVLEMTAPDEARATDSSSKTASSVKEKLARVGRRPR